MSPPDGELNYATPSSTEGTFVISSVDPAFRHDVVKSDHDGADLEAERDLDPFAHADTGEEDRRNAQNTTTNLQTLMHLLKGNIGTGIFAMASAVKNAGLATGTIAIVLMGFICIHCMHILVNCNHHLCKIEGKSALDYGEVVRAAFKQSPYSKFANASKKVIDLFIIVSQFGFCCVYIVYVATTLQDVIFYYTDVKLPIQAYTAMVLPFLILLCYIRSLKVLAPLSLAANLILCTCLVIIFVYVFGHLKSVDSVPQFAGWSKLPLFFGTAIYAFEGIGLVLPIENRMKNPQDFGGWAGILNVGMVIITALYTAAGFFGYLAFGEEIKDTITLNLPYQGIYIVVILLVGLVVFYSYALQFYVPFEILWPAVKKRLRTPLQVKIGEYLFRTGIVILTFLLAVAIPKLGLFISLVGAVGSSSLALIFPPVLETVTFGWRNQGKYQWKLYKNAAIFIFGILGFVTGTYVAILEIVLSFEKDAENSLATTALPTQAVPMYLS